MSSSPQDDGTRPVRLVLFLCTGNYYRSRFAESFFNHLAPTLCPAWSAESRGLALERGVANLGPISRSTRAALAALSVPVPDAPRCPEALTPGDLARAERVVAVQTSEHRPLLLERHATWTAGHLDAVEFWDVADIDQLDPPTALARLETHVRDLCRRLGQTERPFATVADKGEA